MTTPGTAVERSQKREMSPELQAKVEEMQLRNRVATQIRGAVWSKDLDARQIQALAQYCRENALDAVRHVEVLGGRIYLTAEFYDERGADLLRSGEIVPAEPDYINADPRLEELAAKGDEWAKGEKERRLRERIKWAVPEKAAAAVVQRFHIAANGRAVVGLNWCGGGSRQRDPVGEAEPTKTAQTRARRRAWKQIADVIPSYGAVVRPIEENARQLAPVFTVEAPARALPVPQPTGYDDPPPPTERDSKGRPIPVETVATETNPVLEPSGQPATAEEVFGDNPSPAEAAENEHVDIVTGAPLSEAGRWEMPLGEKKGMPIGRIDTDRIVAALDVARNAKRFSGFVAAAETVLEDRREFADNQ